MTGASQKCHPPMNRSSVLTIALIGKRPYFKGDAQGLSVVCTGFRNRLNKAELIDTGGEQ